MYFFLIYGKREAKIKEFSDNSTCCTSCGEYDLQVRVYRKYYHVLFIPFSAFGDKRTDIRCNQCTEPIRTEVLKKVYEKYTRTPFYLYSILLLLTVLIGLLVFAGIRGGIERKGWIAKPRVGDVYQVNKDVDGDKKMDRYFLRVAEINGDTISVYHNNLVYLDYVSQFNPDDYFVQDEKWYYLNAEIQQMYDKDEITTVDREYGRSTGFDRIQ